MTLLLTASRRAALAAAILGLATGAATAEASALRSPITVPEPAMLALLGLGLITVALVSRRR